MPIDSHHPEYDANLNKWLDIRSNLGGEYAIKAQREKYLPKPNPTDLSASNTARYNAYLMRSNYFAATRETQRNLVGRAFSTPPTFTGPDEMDSLIQNVDGSGVTAEQQAKCTLNHVVAYSRAGVFVDYSVTDGEATKADEEAGFVGAKIICYDPFQIINWDTITVGAKTMLSLVVIEEDYVESDDGYEKEYAKQWRELRLIDGVYHVSIWRETEGEKAPIETVIPTDSQGQPFNEIPFIFVGAHANEPMVEYPQLADIANLNLTHYRLSADEKQALHLLQPTLAVSGLNDNWIKNHFANGLSLGSSAYIPLPEGASASLVEPKEITALGEAIRETENQMQRLGAKLVEESEGTKTATEVNSDEAARTSVLASNCNNVSAAYNRALGFVARFAGIDNENEEYPDGATYQINTDFAVIGMTPEEQQALVNSWISGAISYTEMRKKFKEAGIAYQDDEEVKEAHEEKQENDFAKATASFSNQE